MYNPNLWFNQKLEENDRIYHIVYLTTNLVNQKIYVGIHSTNNLNDNYLGSGSTLQFAIRKYGVENFKRDILYYCLTRENIFAIESRIVDLDFVKNKKTYNTKIGGTNTNLHTNETKNILSIKSTFYNKHYNKIRNKTYEEIYGEDRSLIIKQKISEALKDRIVSEETKQKMSQSQKNKIVSEETKEKLRNSCLNKSDELKAKFTNKNAVRTKDWSNKISESLKGKTHSQETKQKMSQSQKNKIVSEETKKKLRNPKSNSEKMGRYQRTEETRKKLSISMKQKQKIKCPHCDKDIDELNYLRWHGDKCKMA
jgi:hypothetical protein